MHLKSANITFSDLKKSNMYWVEEELRLQDKLCVYFLDFDMLPWTAAILAAPKNHIFVSAPSSSYNSIEAVWGVGRLQADWTSNFFDDINIRKVFLKEIRSHKLRESDIPLGLLPYDGGSKGLPKIGFSKKIDRW